MGTIAEVSVAFNVLLIIALLFKREARNYMSAMAEGEKPFIPSPRKSPEGRGGFRRFLIVRDEDISQVSGTGVVCEGVQFSDGHAAIHWLGRWPMTTPHHEGIATVEAIHGHGGKTRVVWIDPQKSGKVNIAAGQGR